MLATQSCPALCDPKDRSPPGFSVQGILQARILQWFAISFSRGSSLSRDQTWVSCIADRFFTTQGLKAPYFSWQHGQSSTFWKLHFLRDSMSGSLIILTPKCLCCNLSRTLPLQYYALWFWALTRKLYLQGFSNGCLSVKNLPAMQEMQVDHWARKIPWKINDMATQSSILAWEIPGTEEPGRIYSMCSHESDTT